MKVTATIELTYELNDEKLEEPAHQVAMVLVRVIDKDLRRCGMALMLDNKTTIKTSVP